MSLALMTQVGLAFQGLRSRHGSPAVVHTLGAHPSSDASSLACTALQGEEGTDMAGLLTLATPVQQSGSVAFWPKVWALFVSLPFPFPLQTGC